MHCQSIVTLCFTTLLCTVHGSGQFFCRSSRSLLHVVCNKRPMAAQSCRVAVSLPSARLPASALLNVCVCVYVYVCVCLPRFVLKCILCLQDGPKRTVQFFKSNGQPAIVRHPLNQRKTGSAMRSYVRRIQESGIIQSVRGEPWFTYEENTHTYHALSCGTLRLASLQTERERERDRERERTNEREREREI